MLIPYPHKHAILRDQTRADALIRDPVRPYKDIYQDLPRLYQLSVNAQTPAERDTN
jgi:hypothetical protein